MSSGFCGSVGAAFSPLCVSLSRLNFLLLVTRPVTTDRGACVLAHQSRAYICIAAAVAPNMLKIHHRVHGVEVCCLDQQGRLLLFDVMFPFPAGQHTGQFGCGRAR